MSRNYANIATAIWRNADFRALNGDAQRMYLLLTSQPDISAAGVLPLSVTRWSRLAADTTRESVVADLTELQTGRFIIFDTETEELLVRSFVRWDGGYSNPKRRPVIERAAREVESPRIVQALVREFERLGISTDGLADSLSASPSVAIHDDPPTAIDDAGPETAFSQANRLSDSQSPSDGVVVTQGLVGSTSTHNPQSPPHEPTRRPRADQGTRLPEDWEPDAEALAWAKERYPAVNVVEATLKFKNHWLAKTGKDATKRDWRRTWQNWIMEENRRLPRPFPANAGYPARQDANGSRRIPEDERCQRHPTFRAASCGPCRSERHGATAAQAKAG